MIDGLASLRVRHPFKPDDLLAGAFVRRRLVDPAVELRDFGSEINAGKKKRFAERFRSYIVETLATGRCHFAVINHGPLSAADMLNFIRESTTGET